MIDLTSLGVRSVRVHPDGCTIAMPKLYVDVDIADLHLVRPGRQEIDLLHRFEIARGQLFRNVIEHIAKHDRSPMDRMKQIEDAALAVLPECDRYDNPAQSALRGLLRSKPGSPTWKLHGYGKETAAP